MVNCPSCEKQLTVPSAICPWCRVLISNPEAGVLASPGRRLMGYILDILVGAVAVLLIGSLGFGSPESILSMFFLGALMIAVINLFFWTQGTSIGKRLLGLTAYKTSGRRAGFLTMLFRETLGKWVSGMVLSLGFLWLLWDRDHQGWHDKIAGTVVLAKR